MRRRRTRYLENGLAKLIAALGAFEGDPFEAAVARLAKTVKKTKTTKKTKPAA